VTFTDPNSLAPLQIPLHPTQLYEMAADLIIFAGLMVARSRLQQEGALFWSYAVSYSLARTVIDFLRGDVLWIGETVRVSHILAATIVGMAFIAFMRPSVFHMTTSTIGREKLRA
jgi:phosphatidylglycerol:prolipoprotein diacylglycerol transferase